MWVKYFGSMSSKNPSVLKGILTIVKYVAWVSVVFIATQIVVGVFMQALVGAGLLPLSENMLNIIYMVISYGVMVAAAIAIPWRWLKTKTTKEELGLTRLMKWSEISWAIVGFIIYFVLLIAVFWLMESFLPGFNLEQKQDVGITSPQYGLEMTMAFLLLVVIGPFFEEVFFRGYLYGKLRTRGISVLVSIVVTSALFGLAHMQLNVGIDTFVLSVVMCLSREFTGSIWPSILMHMMKNGLAFYVGFLA
jgi:membrane protease YdiL (CAAX protease family)